MSMTIIGGRGSMHIQPDIICYFRPGAICFLGTSGIIIEKDHLTDDRYRTYTNRE